MSTDETFEIAGDAELKPGNSILLLWRPVSADLPPIPRGSYRRGPVLEAVASPFFEGKGDISTRTIYGALEEIEEAQGTPRIWARSMRKVRGPVETDGTGRIAIEPPSEDVNRTQFLANYVFETTEGEKLMVLDLVTPTE